MSQQAAEANGRRDSRDGRPVHPEEQEDAAAMHSQPVCHDRILRTYYLLGRPRCRTWHI